VISAKGGGKKKGYKALKNIEGQYKLKLSALSKSRLFPHSMSFYVYENAEELNLGIPVELSLANQAMKSEHLEGSVRIVQGIN
jgi:hypothetical protein